jgi:hypothetical protein
MITKRKIWIGSSIIIAIVSLLFIQSCKKNTTASPFKIPSITTESVTSTETSAMVEANITSNGGITVTKSGVCWSSNDNPTIDDNITTDGILDIGQFSSEINTLTSNTKYYVRAYATNIEGTGYGNTISFTTKGKAQLTTADVTELTAASAVSGGNITNDGGSEITARGVCWNTSIDPTISNNKTSDSVGSGIFSSKIINLTENVLYYARAYATNSSGTSYGNTISFTTTSATKPIITTAAISGITKTSAISGGAISSDGGAAITSRGVCWSTSSNPTIANNKTNDGTGTVTFTSNITALNPNTLYYVRAYATNKAGISYGNEILFSTLIPTMPTLSSTSVISNITQTTATSGGTISDDGGSAITMRGVCWSTSTNPTISNSKTTDGTGTGSFTSNLTGLTAGVTYYVRAYATNSLGTVYGNSEQFTTDAASVPILTTQSIFNITKFTASSGGTISSIGGSTITAKGVCWSTTPNPTISNTKTSDGSGTGNFTSSLTGLTAGTTYYVRAYATNSAGTGYGIAVQFNTTGADLPILTTNAVTNITTTSAGCGGNVTSDGGSAVTIRGICWSTSPNPVYTFNSTSVGSGIGSFSTLISSLARGTKYYVRAYATNSVGTAYGNEVTFNTNVIIGDAFQGGKVFYILQASDYGYNANVQHGLICATADQTTSTLIRWSVSSVLINNTVTTIGYGDINSINITLNQGTGTSYAAGLARAHNGGGYTDWFLPSLNELTQLYNNKAATVTTFLNTLYWSSSEVSSTSARALDFTNGSGLTTGYLKTNTYRVRAIRKF